MLEIVLFPKTSASPEIGGLRLKPFFRFNGKSAPGVKGLPTPWLGLKKNGSNTCMTFFTHKRKIPFLVVPCIKIVYLRFAAQIQFCCKSEQQWTYGSQK